jgi:hypothetical protein
VKRILTLAALCVLLAACFKSEHLLLDLGKATHPIPEGEWVAGDSSDTVFTLKVVGDHYLRTEDKNTYDLVLVPLAGHKGSFVAAESSEGCTGHDATPECNWEYAIVVVGQDETWKQSAPDCKTKWDGMDKDVAKVEDDGETCWFDDPAGLQHALVVAADRGGGTEQLIHRPVAPAPEPVPEEAPADPPKQ